MKRILIACACFGYAAVSVAKTVDQSQGRLKTVALPENLSQKLPEGLIGQPPAMYRLKALPGWTADGVVIERDGFEHIAETGDWVAVHMELELPIASGTRFSVFRRAGPSEEDDDSKAIYLTRVGMIEVRGAIRGTLYKAVVIECSDAVQEDDVVQREE